MKPAIGSTSLKISTIWLESEPTLSPKCPLAARIAEPKAEFGCAGTLISFLVDIRSDLHADTTFVVPPIANKLPLVFAPKSFKSSKTIFSVNAIPSEQAK